MVVHPDRVVAQASARTAMSTALCHLAAAPSMLASSIFQPCGMKTPKMILLIGRTIVASRPVTAAEVTASDG